MPSCVVSIGEETSKDCPRIFLLSCSVLSISSKSFL